jgi:hypothetical protein
MPVLSVRPTAPSAVDDRLMRHPSHAAITLMLPALLRGAVFVSGLASPFIVALLIR